MYVCMTYLFLDIKFKKCHVNKIDSQCKRFTKKNPEKKTDIIRD